MGVVLDVNGNWYEIGAGSFLNSFFSTITFHLENKKRGSRFPLIAKELYMGVLENGNVDGAMKELEKIKEELKNFSPDKIIWDIDDLSKRPPWGNNIASRITDLSNYFVTSDGQDLFERMFEAFGEAKKTGSDIKIT